MTRSIAICDLEMIYFRIWYCIKIVASISSPVEAVENLRWAPLCGSSVDSILLIRFEP